MNNDLIEFLSRFIPVSDELAGALEKSSMARTFAKGTILLREGERATEGFFVLKGCIRSYALADGDDRTIDFFIEEEPAIPLEYGKDEASTHWLECIEETVAVVSTPEQEARMLAEYPQLKIACLTLAEIMADKLRATLARYRISTPEERYRELVERRPALLQRVPQYMIASYLGVQPESLSRIRSRITRLGTKRDRSGRS
jgi:CRP-like cAMP-binding protein